MADLMQGMAPTARLASRLTPESWADMRGKLIKLYDLDDEPAKAAAEQKARAFDEKLDAIAATRRERLRSEMPARLHAGKRRKQ